MYKKGHTGMIKVKRAMKTATEDRPGTLEIKVRIGGNEAKTGNVKDLKQLSGATCLAPSMSRWFLLLLLCVVLLVCVLHRHTLFWPLQRQAPASSCLSLAGRVSQCCFCARQSVEMGQSPVLHYYTHF